ncbi:MAG: hypothetical protein J7J88_00015 [Dehalococcoidia bacterium]|nr:hypothetical protein [Dehalococcoidia bacterium]
MKRLYIPLTMLIISSLILGITGCVGTGVHEDENTVTETEGTDDLAKALELLGLSEEEISFQGYLGEVDLLTLYLGQGESCYLIKDSAGYGSETWFFIAGENAEDTADLEEYLGEYELPDYQWQELADSMLSEEASVIPDVADVVVLPEELEEKCKKLKDQIAELENKLTEMKDKKNELEDKLNNARIEKEKLEVEKENLEAKKATCPDDITALQNEVPIIEGRIEGMVEALKQDVSFYHDCKLRNPSAPSRCKGYLDRVGWVYQRLQALRSELAAKQESLNRLQQECVALDSRIHLSITPKLTKLNQAIQKYEEDTESLAVEIAELSRKIGQIKARYKVCLDDLEELEKLENRVDAARRKAEHTAEDAEHKVNELEEKYEKFKERFPNGVYPGEVGEYRKGLEEIKKEMGAGSSELDEKKVEEAKSEANDLAREVEREKIRLSKYWLANICLANCYKAYELCSQSVESRRDNCGESTHFREAEEALAKLKECCDQAREELINDDVEDARAACYACLYKQELAKAVYEALKKACADHMVITYPDIPGDDEGLGSVEELVDFEKNMGLQAIGELGKIPSAIVQAIEAGKLIGDQQKNACCALMMMKFMLTSRNYFEAAAYADAFVHFWHEISGLPEIPTARTATALGLAEIVDELPEETRDAAISAIEAVLRSARCTGISCY